MPLERLGPLGCGIQTGAGSVMNALKVGPGASFAAFGAGSVGLSAVMAARIVGATHHHRGRCHPGAAWRSPRSLAPRMW